MTREHMFKESYKVANTWYREYESTLLAKQYIDRQKNKRRK
ncbi:hypothetical protein LABALGNA3A7_09450 [Dellaglioa algida]|nr:hypothetical protein LABALGNA3A7_09450 [Dellaglioa algida]